MSSQSISATTPSGLVSAKRRALPDSAAVVLVRVITGVVILLLWEGIVRAIAPAYVAKPSTIFLAIPAVIADATFRKAAADTLLAVAQGLFIAIVLGTLIGLLMGRSQVAERLLRHYVNGFYAVPMIVVLPLLSLWCGYSSLARLATIVFAAVFSIIVNVADGAKSVPREYIEVARSFRSNRLRLMIEVVLPAATPYFLAGLRLAAGRAMIGAVVAEFFIAIIGGLGYFILYQSRSFHHNEAFVGVIALAGSCVGFELFVQWCTRRYLPWYRRDEKME